MRAAIARIATPQARLPETDPERIRRVHRILEPICRYYFRSDVRGLDRVPEEQTLLVSNHDGGNLPVDGICLGAAWHRHFGFERPLRVLMHTIPFKITRALTQLLHDVGCIPAFPDQFEACVSRGESALLYPGAARESFRPFHRRRQVDLGGRTGFVTRALRHGLTITPVASVGAHETMFILGQGARLARFLRIDRNFHADAWPLIAGFPLGLWFGPMFPHLPLPSKIVVEVLPPIPLAHAISERLGRRIGRKDAEDRAVVRLGFEMVRDAVQQAVARLYRERRFPVFG